MRDLRFAQRLLIRVAFTVVGLISGRRRILPLRAVLALRRVGFGPNPLMANGVPVDGRVVRPEPLGQLLKGQEVGTWSLGPESLHAILELVIERRPEAILEFGSGVSSVALAWALHQCHGGGVGPRLLSIEQSEEYAQRSRAMLARAGLAEESVVITAPLRQQNVEDHITTCYSLDPAMMSVLDGRRVELILVDGPAGPVGSRFGTLPLIRPLLSARAVFVLDDALRDGELEIARLWRHLPYIRLQGIRLVEKGLLVGMVTP